MNNLPTKHPVDSLYDIVKFTLSQPNTIVKSKFATDPVNAYAERAFNIKVSTNDPVNLADKLFDVLKNISEAKNESRTTGKVRDKIILERNLGTILDGNDSATNVINSFAFIKDQVNQQKKFSSPVARSSDPVNSLAKKSFMPDVFAVKASHTLEEVKALIRKCYPAASFNLDPVNDLTGISGLSLSKIKAKHSFDELCNLVDNIVGQVIPVRTHSLKLDEINAVASEKFGFKSKSKAEPIVVKVDKKEAETPAPTTVSKITSPVRPAVQNIKISKPREDKTLIKKLYNDIRKIIFESSGWERLFIK